METKKVKLLTHLQAEIGKSGCVTYVMAYRHDITTSHKREINNIIELSDPKNHET